MRRVLKVVTMLALLGSSLSGQLQAQLGGPDDYDLKLVPEKKILRQEEELTVNSTVVVRKAGVLGWSYGVEHDETLLEIVSATTVGSDVPTVFLDGFNQTAIIKREGVSVGWIQAIVLSLSAEKRELPISAGFVMAKAKYKVLSGICAGKGAEIPTTVAYSNKLSVPGSPPVEINLTVEGTSVEPKLQESASVVIECPQPGALDLKLEAVGEDRKLIADQATLMSIQLNLKNSSTTNAAEIQGWSYGLRLDPAVLEVVDLTLGADAALLNGGAGPDFKAYNFKPLDQNVGGTIKGVTVGVVISLDPPNEALAIAAGASKKLDLLKVKSAATIAVGGADKTTELAFVSEVLGGDRPIENIITVGGLSISPKSDTPSLTITLTAPGVEKRFKRGFANPDGRYDIADGVWTIRVLFYREGTLACMDAADSNDDGRVDLADAIYTFNYLLQPGKRGGDSLYSKPPEPFTSCGVDPSADDLTCDQATSGCN